MALNLDEDSLEPLMKKPSTSTSDVLGKRFGLALLESETLSAGRFIEQKIAAREDDIMLPEEANKAFDFDVPVSEPTSKAELELIQDITNRRRDMRDIIDRGEDTFATNFFGPVAGFAGYAIDPIGILAGKAIGLGKFGASVINKTIGKSFLQGSAWRKVVESGIEGAFGNALSEVAVSAQSKKELQDINTTKNILMAAGTGAAFPVALGSIGIAFEKVFSRFKDVPPDKMGNVTDLVHEKINSEKIPIITDQEIKIASLPDTKKLKSQLKRLEKRKLKNPEAKNIDAKIAAKKLELDNTLETLESSKDLKAKTNAKENDIYYDPDAEARIKEIDGKEKTDQELFDDEFSDEALAKFSPDEQEAIKEALAPYKKAKGMIGRVATLAHDCVTKGTK